MLAATDANMTNSGAVPRRLGRGQAERKGAIKILVVDAHFLIREALRDCLKAWDSSAIILEAVNGQEAMQLVSEHSDIRLIVLELNLPDLDGFSVLGELHEHHPKTSVVVLSTWRDRDIVTRALDLGALGFIPKSELREVMLGAFNLVLSGGLYIPPEFISQEQPALTSPMLTSPRLTSIASGPRAVKPADLGLTGRQTDVLRLMLKGKSNKAISRALNLALPTVKNHVTAILKAINVTNRTEAVIATGGLDLD
jgi:DNA-binding NarL/FixJ family response regulator